MVKSKTLSITITRYLDWCYYTILEGTDETQLTGVLSASQLRSCAVDDGVAAAADPPPTVAEPNPRGVPTARATGIMAERVTKTEVTIDWNMVGDVAAR